MDHDLTPTDDHLTALAAAIVPFRAMSGKLARWGSDLAWHLGQGGRLLVAGNGGSAAEAQHLAAELVGRLRDERRPLSAIALTPDSSAVTAIGNDYGFERIFERQLEGLANEGDVALGISTSGNSDNVIRGLQAAAARGAVTVAITGGGGGRMREVADHFICVPAGETPRIQEGHILVAHILCELIEAEFASEA